MSATDFKPSDFAWLGIPCCSIWGKSEIESIALAYVQALANGGDTWRKLSRQETCELLTKDQLGDTHGLLSTDYYQLWFDTVSNVIVDSDGAISVEGFWNLHRLAKFAREASAQLSTNSASPSPAQV